MTKAAKATVASSPPRKRPTARANPTPGGTMQIGVEAESGGWQPCVDSPSESGTMVFLAVYDQLMARSEDGEVKPWLAESLTPSADKLSWTLKLRPNVKFHDGTALDSAVLKQNFDANTSATSRSRDGAQADRRHGGRGPADGEVHAGRPVRPLPRAAHRRRRHAVLAGQRRRQGCRRLGQPGRHRPVHLQVVGARLEADAREEPELLAEGSSVPRPGDRQADPRRGRPPRLAQHR